MGIRRQAREAALQISYMCDCLDTWDKPQMEFCFDYFEIPKVVRSYAITLCEVTANYLPQIDSRITCASEHWSLNRMSRIDRCLLRLATYEMFYLQDIPASVAINEAIEVAKRFGAKDSPMFINGVLDRVAAQLRTQVEVVAQAQHDAGGIEGDSQLFSMAYEKKGDRSL